MWCSGRGDDYTALNATTSAAGTFALVVLIRGRRRDLIGNRSGERPIGQMMPALRLNMARMTALELIAMMVSKSVVCRDMRCGYVRMS